MNRYNCVVLRMGEKEVLRFYQEMARKMVRFMSIPKITSSRDKYESLSRDLKAYEPYIRSLPFFQ